MKTLCVNTTGGTVIHEDGSYLCWRRGTGDNVEITNLKAVTPGHGTGTRLLKDLLTLLLDRPPYATVYGFTRACNVTAQEFYAASGFALSPVVGVYADGAAIVFSAKYAELCKRHGVGPGGGR